MDSLEVRELIVVGIHADTKEEAGVSSVDDLVVAELYDVAKREELGESRERVGRESRRVEVISDTALLSVERTSTKLD